MPNTLSYSYQDLEVVHVPADITTLAIYSSKLGRIVFPEDSQLKTLRIMECEIREFPDKLPDTLEHLILRYTDIDVIKHLPSNLMSVDVSFTGVRSLPALPRNLVSLWMEGTQMTEVPDVPDSLVVLYTMHNDFLPIDFPLSFLDILYFSQHDYVDLVRHYQQKRRQRFRMSLLKESLMAAAWHPARVERWVEAGVEDMMFGC